MNFTKKDRIKLKLSFSNSRKKTTMPLIELLSSYYELMPMCSFSFNADNPVKGGLFLFTLERGENKAYKG